MRIIIHPSVPFIETRLRIWHSKASKMGLQLVKYNADTPLQNGDKLLIGADCPFLEQQIVQKLPQGHYLIVRDKWIEACMSAGNTNVPVLPYIVPTSKLRPPDTLVTAQQQHRQDLKRLHPHSDHRNNNAPVMQVATTAAVDTNAAETAALDSGGRLIKRPRHAADTPVAAGTAAAAAGPAMSAAVLDALRVITGRRLWVPAQQQQQQQLGQADSIRHQQQQQQQDLLVFQQQQRPLPRLDVSWMSPTAIRVVTYNLLADMYCSNRNTKSYCPIHLRQWDSRWPRIAAELAAYQPHILCLQEVDDHLWYTDILPWLQQQLDMQGLIWCRDYAGRNSGVREGIALLLNKSRFKLLQQKTVRFADHTPHTTSPELVEFWANVSDYEEGAIFALLQDTKTNQLLVTCCTHLWYSPKTPDIKVGQAEILCKCCVDFIQQQCRDNILAHVGSNRTTAAAGSSAADDVDLLQEVPVVIGGDFNSLWRKYKSDAFDRLAAGQSFQVSGVYELLSTGRLVNTHPHHPSFRHGHNRNNSNSSSSNRHTIAADAPVGETPAAKAVQEVQNDGLTPIQDYVFSTHGLQLQSSYLSARGYEPALTNKHPGFAGCLDYVWFSTGQMLKVAGTLAMPYETLGFTSVPEDPERVPFVHIPDDVWPSDHLAVGTVLDWHQESCTASWTW